MKYTIELDDRSKTGKNLLGLIEDLSKSNKTIKFISEKEEDKMFLQKMNAAMDTGLISDKESNSFITKLRSDARK